MKTVYLLINQIKPILIAKLTITKNRKNMTTPRTHTYIKTTLSKQTRRDETTFQSIFKLSATPYAFSNAYTPSLLMID